MRFSCNFVFQEKNGDDGCRQANSFLRPAILLIAAGVTTELILSSECSALGSVSSRTASFQGPRL